MKNIDNYIKMISFNDYILEKLKIDKNTTLYNYKVGDRCLSISIMNWESNKYFTNNNSIFILPDVLEISEINISSKKIKYKYVTSYFHKTDETFGDNYKLETDEKNINKYIYFVLDEDMYIEIIIPHELSLDLIDKFEHNKKFNIFDFLDFYPDFFDNIINKELPISFNSQIIDYDEAKIKELKDKLYETN